MRIQYLTQWFDPEQGVFKGARFVRALEAAGHQVAVVTGFPNYPTGRLYPGYRLKLIMRETLDGARVVRLPLYPNHDRSSLRRALNFLSFFVSALIYGLLRRERDDLVYVYHPPITVGLAAALVGFVRRRPFVIEIQDLWPDTIAVTGMGGARWLARWLDPVCRLVYRRAKAIVVQSAGMRRVLIDRGVPAAKITVIRNWADVQDLPVCEDRPHREGVMTIVYGGNLGRAQALGTVIDAAGIVERERRDVRILLYGDGIDAAALRERARDKRVTILEFHDRVSSTAIIPIFAQADALLLHLAHDPLFAITIPSKTQFYMAMGRPIVAGVAGEAAELLRESGAAFVAPPEDAEALAQAICNLADLPRDRREAMGRMGQDFYRRTLSFEEGVRQTLAFIDDLDATPRSSPTEPSVR